MNPMNLIFNSISDLTGGLITDLTTAVIGLLVISFIVFGIELLGDMFSDFQFSRNTDRRVRSTFEELQKARQSGSQLEKDMALSRYRNALNRYGRGRGER